MSSDRRVQKALETLQAIGGGTRLAADVLERLAGATGEAADLRDAFLNRRADPKTRRVRVPDPSGVLYELGELTEVGYLAKKGRDRREYEFVHRFGSPLPVLSATLEGGLVVVGGGYRITPAGIVG